jgi:hypothetical protein
MLARLGSLLKEKGRLSRILVDKADGVPYHSTHVARYGTMGNAYELIGHHPKGVFNYIGGGNSLTTTILKLATDIIAKVEGTAGYAAFNKATDVLTINFPGTRRLAIKDGDHLEIFHTGNHRIFGVAQAQSSDQTLTFTSQDGLVRVNDLPKAGDQL